GPGPPAPGRGSSRAVPLAVPGPAGRQGPEARGDGGASRREGASGRRGSLKIPMGRAVIGILVVTGLLAALLVPAGPAPAQTPSPQPTRRPPTFEAGIEVINLNVSVTDARNRYVTDLTNRDFAVFEDGIRQDLTLFSHENLPISMVLMIDTSASMDEKLPVAQEAAGRFIKTLRPEDLARVSQFNDRI